MASPWLLLLLIFSLSLLCLRGWSQNTKPQELEYECVDIDKQPSLQHPQLKSHQIQMRPSDEVLTMLSRDALSQNLSNDDEAVVEFDIPEEGCPQGQVPIHKPRRLNHTEKSFHPNGGETLVQHYAVIKKIDAIPWRGASAVVGIYQPKVTNNDQFSLALIWLTTSYDDQRNSAWFGWAVFPEIYGDTRTRLTAYWTPDDDVNGCYNVICKGFVQIDKRIFLGAPFAKISVKGGQQYSALFSIHQDPRTHNFLLTVGNTYIGYWPEKILPLFKNRGAETVRFGGITNTRSDGLQPYEIISPPMGNGNKPLEDEVNLKHTGFMHSVKYVAQDYQIVNIDDNNVTEDADAGKCYDVIYLGNFGPYGKSFTFGGPGGVCDV